MFKTIVVPVDASKRSERVLPYVQDLAGKFGSEIALIGVIEEKPEKDIVLFSSPTILYGDVLRLYLSDITKKIKSESFAYGMGEENIITSEILKGKIARSIIQYADEKNADLIALTNKGASDEEEWELGSITNKVIRATKKPVLLIRAAVKKNNEPERNKIKNILLPLDGSKLGEAAIPLAEALVEKYSANLFLLHVTEPMTKWGIYDTNPSNPSLNSLENRNEEAKIYLNGVGDLLKSKGFSVSSAIRFGLPARQILEHASENSIDLIAMSTHGRSGIGQWVFGSVTEKILQSGDIPILVVRPF